MRKEKVLKLGDREIAVRELRVKDVRELFENLRAESPLEENADALNAWLPRLTDLKLADLEEMYPSEIKKVMDAMLEVNADFFEVARTLGMEPLLKLMQGAVAGSLIGKFVGSSKPDTARSSDTDGVSS